MRLLTWNIAGRLRHGECQTAALIARSPDLVALQEVTCKIAEGVGSSLAAPGLTFQASSACAASSPKRAIGILIASRWPIEPLDLWPGAIPWTEKALSVRVLRPNGAFDLHAVHIPNGSANGWTKIETLEGVFRVLSRPVSAPRILCGDFNTPQKEFLDGRVATWAQNIRRNGTLTITRSTDPDWDGDRWDAGERNVLVGLREHDLSDVYRLTGTPEDATYFARHGKGQRFDHVFASRALEAVRCAHLHDFRLAGMSDHSAVEVDFAA